MATTFNSVSDLLANNSSQSSQKPDKTKADSTMFMTLLVAQLKNQDPLAPQDGAAFVAQLAQFNSLEQLTGIKQSIDKLVTQMQ